MLTRITPTMKRAMAVTGAIQPLMVARLLHFSHSSSSARGTSAQHPAACRNDFAETTILVHGLHACRACPA